MYSIYGSLVGLWHYELVVSKHNHCQFYQIATSLYSKGPSQLVRPISFSPHTPVNWWYIYVSFHPFRISPPQGDSESNPQLRGILTWRNLLVRGRTQKWECMGTGTVVWKPQIWCNRSRSKNIRKVSSTIPQIDHQGASPTQHSVPVLHQTSFSQMAPQSTSLQALG